MLLEVVVGAGLLQRVHGTDIGETARLYFIPEFVARERETSRKAVIRNWDDALPDGVVLQIQAVSGPNVVNAMSCCVSINRRTDAGGACSRCFSLPITAVCAASHCACHAAAADGRHALPAHPSCTRWHVTPSQFRGVALVWWQAGGATPNIACKSCAHAEFERVTMLLLSGATEVPSDGVAGAPHPAMVEASCGRIRSLTLHSSQSHSVCMHKSLLRPYMTYSGAAFSASPRHSSPSL
jgi:hypothetical protein